MAELDIFLRFPETEDEILELGDDLERYRGIVKSLRHVKALARAKATPALKYRIFYCSANIKSFVEKANTLFNGKHLHNIANSIREILGATCSNIQSCDTFKKDAEYHNWNLGTCQTEPSEDIVKGAAQKNIDEPGCAVIQMLNGSDWYKRAILPVVVDSYHHHEHPLLSVIKISSNIDDLGEIFASKVPNGFSLKGNPVFQKTNYIYSPSNQNIFLNTDNNTYWYFDFFHKDNKIHYEVFDSRGDHIGEADQYGNLTPGSKDDNKKITKYLQ